MILFLDFGSFPASFQLPETLPLEEQIADRDGPDGAYQVGQKTAGHRVTGVFNTHTAKIYGQNIEGCIGRSLQNAAQTAHETVGAIALHGLQHHAPGTARSEEHTSELQSRQYLVCRLLLEKKKKDQISFDIKQLSKTQNI